MTELEKTALEEIEYRKSLTKKYVNGGHPSKEERFWAQTHSAYDHRLGYPYYTSSVEKIGTDKPCILTLCIEEYNFDGKIHAILGVPAGKGEILTDMELVDLYGNKSVNKPVKMLGFNWLGTGEQFSVKYRSKLALLSVEYECECYLSQQNRRALQSSGVGAGLSFKREPLNEHKLRYYCKSPESDNYDALIFTVEWIEETG